MELIMTKITIQNLITLIKDVCEQDELAQINLNESNANLSFDELGLDSLSLLSVIAQLEQKTDIKIGFEAATTATSPNDLYQLVQEKLNQINKAA